MKEINFNVLPEARKVPHLILLYVPLGAKTHRSTLCCHKKGGRFSQVDGHTRAGSRPPKIPIESQSRGLNVQFSGYLEFFFILSFLGK